MKSLKDCKWVFEITKSLLSDEAVYQWRMKTEVSRYHRYPNGGIGSIGSVRLYTTEELCRKEIKQFIKVNNISNFEIKKV
tara:strand:- start:3494 stop:3733 length:240 start_codon:yes stop_codon:yes gene_type:complete